jgi:hypothetical protein
MVLAGKGQAQPAAGMGRGWRRGTRSRTGGGGSEGKNRGGSGFVDGGRLGRVPLRRQGWARGLAGGVGRLGQPRWGREGEGGGLRPRRRLDFCFIFFLLIEVVVVFCFYLN